VPARLYSASNLPPGIGGKSLIAAAELGDPAAAFEIGTRLAEGRGVPANLEQALVWFERAARTGLVPAQFRLGSAYEKGEGTPRDPARARDLYTAAAQQGHAKAMHNLAVLYAEGIDGKPDYANAVQWFRRSAQFGLADSQYNLGVLYARGIGVEPNLAESYKWFALAAQQGDREAAAKREDVAKRLDPNTLNAAIAAVRSWTAQPQSDAATTVTAPPGGWDPPSVPATKPKPKSRAVNGAKPATG
jgi:localization factor PodJL